MSKLMMTILATAMIHVIGIASGLALLSIGKQERNAGAVHAKSSSPDKEAKIVFKEDVVYGRVQGAGLLADIAYPVGKGSFPVSYVMM